MYARDFSGIANKVDPISDARLMRLRRSGKNMTVRYSFSDLIDICGTAFVVEEPSWSQELQEVFLSSKARYLRFSYGAGWDTYDYSFLEKIPSDYVEGIEIYSPSSVDVTPLKHFTNLKMLALRPYKGKLNIEKWQGLEVLKLKYKNTIRDFIRLPKLHTLYMDNIPGEDFSMIEGMTQLKRLSIHGGKQTSVNGLQYLKNLDYLELYRLKHIQDWYKLIESYAVKRINIEKCGIINYATSKEAFMKALNSND